MKKILFLTILPFLLTCESDDICADATSTTPRAIIRFYNINDPDNTKQVRNLTVVGLGKTDSLVYNTSTDSIILPLKQGPEDIYLTTSFLLKKDTDYDIDTNAGNFSNTDTINLINLPKLKYVSRACGYRLIYEENEISISNDNDNWMYNYQIMNTTIDDETEAHIRIYH
jgi:hypothetical protein